MRPRRSFVGWIVMDTDVLSYNFYCSVACLRLSMCELVPTIDD